MVSSVGNSNILGQIAMAEMRQRMFNKIDANGDGKIDKDELTKASAKNSQSGVSADDIMSALDTIEKVINLILETAAQLAAPVPVPSNIYYQEFDTFTDADPGL